MFDESKRDTDKAKQNKTMKRGFVNSTTPFHRFYSYLNKAKVNWILSFIRSLNIKVVLKAICSQGEVLPVFSIYIYIYIFIFLAL